MWFLSLPRSSHPHSAGSYTHSHRVIDARRIGNRLANRSYRAYGDLRCYSWRGVCRSIGGEGSSLIKAPAPSRQTSYISESVAAQNLGNTPAREVAHGARLGELARTAIYSLGSSQESAEESAAAIAARLSGLTSLILLIGLPLT